MKTIELYESYSITIAQLIDYCCDTSYYLNLLDQEAFNPIQQNTFFWQLLEEKS